MAWTKKKQIMKNFLEQEKVSKVAVASDPKTMIKAEYRQGKISKFAAADLIRLYEVMDEAESIQ